MELSELRAQREQAKHRKRRIIFNNDGCDVVYNLKEVSPEALLADRTTGLIGSHVDSIFYCPWSGGLGHVSYISDVAEPFLAKTRVFAPNLIGAFHEAGLDPLQIMIDFCRENGIEIFMSMRMNDVHDSQPRWTEMIPQFKKDHPELLHGSLEDPPAFGLWSGLNYDEPEVQERAFELLEDVCKRYDVDGIELDWLRHPPHFKCSANGEDCTQLERDIMTGLHRRIREMTEQVGMERGRPMLVAVRLPASVACCEAMGLDLRAWLKEDLVDLLVPGEMELAPWETWVDLGREHDVPVYPDLTWSGSRRRQGPPDAQDGIALRNFRARAMNVWHAGADGIHTFNLFDPSSAAWREVGEPEVLAGLDKDYFPDGHYRFLLGREIKGLLRFYEYPTALDPERPMKLDPTRPFTVIMTIGEDPSGKGSGSNASVTLSVRVDDLTEADGLEVRLNDHALSNGALQEEWVSYGVEPERIRKGANTIKMINRDPSNKVVLKDIHVRIVYPRTH